jgi:hypothetical protein
VGLNAVVVDGRLVLDEGRMTGERPGHFRQPGGK